MPRPTFPETGIPGGPTLGPKSYIAEKSIQPIEQTGPANPPRLTNLTPDEIREYFNRTQERMSAAWLRVDPAQLPFGITIFADTKTAGIRVHLDHNERIHGVSTPHGRTYSTEDFTIYIGNEKRDPKLAWNYKTGMRRRDVSITNSQTSLDAVDGFLNDLLIPASKHEIEEPQSPVQNQLAFPTVIDQFNGTFLRPFPNFLGLELYLPDPRFGTWNVQTTRYRIDAERYKKGSGVLEKFHIDLKFGNSGQSIGYEVKPDNKPWGERTRFWKDEATEKSLAATQRIANLGVAMQKSQGPLILGL